jgi:predicted dehydrogenase
MEGLWTLFLPAYRRFFELSCIAEVGQVKSLIASFGYPVSPETQSHTKDPVGVLLDRGIYLIALALAVFGPVDEVETDLKFSDSGEEEDAFLQLRHSGGGFSQLSASFTSLMPNTATLSCSRGLIELEAPLIGSEGILTRQTAIMRSDLDVAQPSSFRTKLVRKLRENPKLRRINRLRNKSNSQHVPFGSDQYLPQLDHFLGLMRAKTPESDIVPMRFSQDIIRIIDRARSNNAYDRRNLKS